MFQEVKDNDHTIHNRATGETQRFSYQDAVVEGDYVFLRRASPNEQQAWPTRNVDITATEGDWVYIVMPDGTRRRVREFHGFTPQQQGATPSP